MNNFSPRELRFAKWFLGLAERAAMQSIFLEELTIMEVYMYAN